MTANSCEATSSKAAINRLAAFAGENRPAFLAFIEARGVSSDLAEDILQRSLLKAIEGVPDLRHADRLESWFYQIVRNVVHDGRRRLATETQALARYASEPNAELEPDPPRPVCLCLRTVFPTLRAEYRRVIEELELARRDPADFARLHGITRNNLNVLRHRARQQLRQQLALVCIACPSSGSRQCGFGLVRRRSVCMPTPDSLRVRKPRVRATSR